MNWKKFLIAFIAVWIFTFIYGFVFHGMIMHSTYQQIPGLLRPDAEFKANFPLLVLGQGVIAFFFTLIFVRGFGSGGGVAGGFRYGLLLGLLFAAWGGWVGTASLLRNVEVVQTAAPVR